MRWAVVYGRAPALIAFALILYTVLAIGRVLTTLPICDEGFYGVPAYSLMTEGHLRNTVLESAHIDYLRGIERRFYWMAPLGMVFQAAAFRLFGFQLFTQRALSALCGMGVVWFWYVAMRHLVPPATAALSSCILAGDFLFLIVASCGRADMMSLFFGTLALASFLSLRKTSRGKALLVANFFCAISGLIHPNEGILAFTSLFILMAAEGRDFLYRDGLLYAAIPYAMLGVAWGTYIAAAPSLFVAQFVGNVRHRMSPEFGHGWIVLRELKRYISAFQANSFHGASAIRLLLPLAYLTSIVGFLGLRRRQTQGERILVYLLMGQILALTVFEKSKQGVYTVYLIPVLSAIMAVWVSTLMEKDTRSSKAMAWLLLLAPGVSLLNHAVSIHHRHYQMDYAPLAAYLNAHVKPQQTVFGRSELYFSMNCKTCLCDDERLGYFSGKVADYIVLDADYKDTIHAFSRWEPQTYAYVQKTLSSPHYSPVFRNDSYEVLAHR